jgi:small subunit ribosomal protein S6
VPTYETLFITPPNLSEDDERATVDAMAQIVTSGGGSMVANDRMGRRRLGYPIRKFEDGVYVRFLFDATPDVAKELERRGRLSENVLRSLTVRLELDWAQHAKEEAAREAQRRVEAEAAAAAEAEKAKAEAEAAAAAEAGSDSETAGDEPGETSDETAQSAGPPEAEKPVAVTESAPAEGSSAEGKEEKTGDS